MQESGTWTKAAGFASLAAAIAIHVGIQFGTAVFCVVVGPIALVAGLGAFIQAVFRQRGRDLIPAVFAIMIGGLETFFLIFRHFSLVSDWRLSNEVAIAA